MMPGPTHCEDQAEAGQHQVCSGCWKVDSSSLTPPHLSLDTRGWAIVGARRSRCARTSHVCPPRPAEPHPVAAYQPLRP